MPLRLAAWAGVRFAHIRFAGQPAQKPSLPRSLFPRALESLRIRLPKSAPVPPRKELFLGNILEWLSQSLPTFARASTIKANR